MKPFRPTSADLTRQRRFGAHLTQAFGMDSPRSALSAARALGGVEANPHLAYPAARANAIRTLSALLDASWPPEVPNWKGIPATRSACQYGSTSMLKSLLEAGADTLAESENRLGALGICAELGRVDLIDMLLAAPSNRSRQNALDAALAEACAIDTPQSAEGSIALIQRGANWLATALVGDQSRTLNLAQIAALKGPLPQLIDTPGFSIALASRQPPAKGRGAWLDWRSIGLAPERPILAEKAILSTESAPQPNAAPKRALRV